MVALIERGAPRDFRDIFMLCQSGLSHSEECWDLWRQRQAMAGSDPDFERAHLAILTHLARISQHRPLEKIIDPQARAEAEKLRAWFKEQFLESPD